MFVITSYSIHYTKLYEDSWNGGIHIGSKPFYENSHQNITIKNNNIKTSTTGIQVNGCTGLEISGNYVEVVKGVNEQGILLENVVDVKEKNNSVRNNFV